MKLPAGKYYIGDPCYVIDNRDWDRFVEVSFEGNKQVEVTEFDGYKMYAYGTAYGDGVYYDDDNNRYGVDAGMLSVVPLDLVDSMSEARRLGRIVEFKKEFEAYEHDGVFHFGDIVIPTN